MTPRVGSYILYLHNWLECKTMLAEIDALVAHSATPAELREFLTNEVRPEVLRHCESPYVEG